MHPPGNLTSHPHSSSRHCHNPFPITSPRSAFHIRHPSCPSSQTDFLSDSFANQDEASDQTLASRRLQRHFSGATTLPGAIRQGMQDLRAAIATARDARVQDISFFGMASAYNRILSDALATICNRNSHSRTAGPRFHQDVPYHIVELLVITRQLMRRTEPSRIPFDAENNRLRRSFLEVPSQ